MMRRNSVADFFSAFNNAYDTTTRVGRDFEIAKASREKPEDADVAQPGMLGPQPEGQDYPTQKGQKFLGKTYDIPLNEQQISDARAQAMAGIYDKYGDAETANRMRSSITQNKMASAQLAQVERQGKREDREDSYVEGRKNLFSNTIFSQKQAGFANDQSKYEMAMKDYQGKVNSGATDAVAPVAPQKPSYGMAESLVDKATLLAHDIEHNKAGSSDLVGLAQMRKQVDDEGYGSALKMAQSGAPIAEVAKLFNEGGKVKLDPKSIVSDKFVDRGNGIKSRVITVKDPDGSTNTIDVLSELDAMGEADKLFSRMFQAKGIENQGKQIGLSQQGVNLQGRQVKLAEDERTRVNTERDAGKAAAVGLALEQNPKATLPYMAAVQSGLISPVAKKSDTKVEASEVVNLLGDPAIGQDGKELKNPMTGKVETNRNKPKEQAFFQYMKKNGIKDTNEGLLKFLSEDAPQPAKPKDANDAMTQAKAAVKGGVPMMAVNAQLKEWGYAPLN